MSDVRTSSRTRIPRTALVAVVALATAATTTSASGSAAPSTPPGKGPGPAWSASPVLPDDSVMTDSVRPGGHTVWAAGMTAVRDANGGLVGFAPAMWERNERKDTGRKGAGRKGAGRNNTGWNGTGWYDTGWKRLATAPVPAGDHVRFNAVDASSPRDGLVVGDYAESLGGIVTQHWNGRKWRTALVPVPEGTRNAGFLSVDHLDSHNAWATGWTAAPPSAGLPDRPLLQHWNGTKWRQADLPDLGEGPGGGFEVNGVSAGGRRDVWAVGGISTAKETKPLALRFDGSRWKKAALPPVGDAPAWLEAVVTAPDGTAWAVGQTRPPGGGRFGFVLRYDGKRWSEVALPEGTPVLSSVALSEGEPVVFAGAGRSGFSVLRRTGGRWTSMDLPATLGGAPLRTWNVAARGNAVDVLATLPQVDDRLLAPQVVLTARR
ncbi:hypothetical protein [Streptomyces yaizuensis]|uniref:Uncharacterized protein n=1 Tax=Streptomyces yaizuensis TaxID=2989713 RepID=A0ABQ5P9J2_9ACTN|nr:hypothetical protein [Streptomyces sp. YSPA8]GLF99240.1 hypothetical protein SYYSPA8_33105 [Streptomyces sp. YSPA8]